MKLAGITATFNFADGAVVQVRIDGYRSALQAKVAAEQALELVIENYEVINEGLSYA